MITVHHLENSRSQRVLWLLEELGCEYEVKRYARDAQTSLAPPALRAVHPLGKSPVITDDGEVVAESGNIIEYLVDKYDTEHRLHPRAGTPEHRQHRYWMHYAEGTLAPLLVLSLVLNKMETAPMPFFVRPIAKGIAGKIRGGYVGPNLDNNLQYLADHLQKHAWFCGEDFGAADVMMSFGLEAAATRSDVMQKHPRLAEVLAAMQARPAYQRALERGGPYQLMG